MWKISILHYHSTLLPTALMWQVMQSPTSVGLSVCPSVRPFVFTLFAEPADIWPWTFEGEQVMTIARRDWRSRIIGQSQGQGQSQGHGSAIFLFNLWCIDNSNIQSDHISYTYSMRENAVVVTTVSVNETANRLPIVLVLGSNHSINTNRRFDYRSNPNFTDIRPTNHLTV